MTTDKMRMCSLTCAKPMHEFGGPSRTLPHWVVMLLQHEQHDQDKSIRWAQDAPTDLQCKLSPSGHDEGTAGLETLGMATIVSQVPRQKAVLSLEEKLPQQGSALVHPKICLERHMHTLLQSPSESGSDVQKNGGSLTCSRIIPNSNDPTLSASNEPSLNQD